jgi:hypothetical protein
VAWVLVVFSVVSGQPFLLGFYVDDWPSSAAAAQVGAPFSKALWEFVYSIDPSRPGLVPVRYLLSSLFEDHAFLWQCGLVIANGVTALILVELIRLFGASATRSTAIPIWAGLCWLLIPWNAAAQFWTVFVPNVVALIGFGLLSVLLIRGWRAKKHNALWAGVIYLWICLSYEAFYFQWVALILIGLVLVRIGRARLRDVLASTAALVVAQLCAAVWYLYSKPSGNPTRPIVSDWPRVAFGDLLTTLPSMFRSAGQVGIPLAVLALILAAVWGSYCYRLLRSSELRAPAQKVIMLGGCFLVGGVSSIFAFALGGRGIDATGVGTRTLLLLSFWFIVGAGVCTMTTFAHASRRARVGIQFILVALGSTLAIAHLLRLGEWATAWRLETKILAEAPLEDLRRTPTEAAILYINPVSVNGAPIFTALWDLGSAMCWKYPFLRGRIFVVYGPRDGIMTWDGERLAYGGRRPFLATAALYVWMPASGRFWRAHEPFRVRRDLTLEDLCRHGPPDGAGVRRCAFH